jgi:hypothetical protein
MPTGDQPKIVCGGMGDMRISAGLIVSTLGGALALWHPSAAAAQGDPTWQTCI